MDSSRRDPGQHVLQQVLTLIAVLFLALSHIVYGAAAGGVADILKHTAPGVMAW